MFIKATDAASRVMPKETIYINSAMVSTITELRQGGYLLMVVNDTHKYEIDESTFKTLVGAKAGHTDINMA